LILESDLIDNCHFNAPQKHACFLKITKWEKFMKIEIIKIVGESGDFSIVELKIGTEKLTAKVCDIHGLLGIGNDTIQYVETEYDQLLNIKLIDNFYDSDSNICANNNNILIKGRVNQILEIGDETLEIEDETLIHVYLNSDLGYITILKSEIGNLELKVGQGVEIEVNDLELYTINF